MGKEAPLTCNRILTRAEWPPLESGTCMDSDMIEIESARQYANRHGLRLGEPLGAKLHGSVWLVQDNVKGGASALKIHRDPEFHDREVAVYFRLEETAIRRIRGFSVPQLIATDPELQALEMTVVEAPYLLDFAGARLDFPPEFPEEVWADWEAARREQFGGRWGEVKRVLSELEDLGIHLFDVNPGNLRFAD